MSAVPLRVSSFRFRVTERAIRSASGATPNPSFERTRHGSPLQAFISFWALRGLLRRASQLKR